MKKFFIFVFCYFLFTNLTAQAINEAESIHLRDNRIQTQISDKTPLWTDYVPKKYENPRTDFRKGSAIAELTVGIILTDLLITSPIGIPMICHSATKIKNISYANKKDEFFEGLEEAKKLPPEEQERHYKKLLKKCKMKKLYID